MVDKIFDEIDNGRPVFLPFSKFVGFIKTLEDCFHSENLVDQLRKLDPNESGSLERFDFVGWYVYKEVALESAEEAENLVGWGCNFILMDIQ